ncbi:MAG: glycogen/starch/alpha-glucan family phosphorylase [Oscillospiraceae bacterium]|nr:glycogen/starch/alpha-glucan family phosphorylase [Oscillospiraceae bacterium]
MLNYTKDDLKKILTAMLDKPAAEVTPQALHDAVGRAVMELMAVDWEDSRNAHRHGRHACYLSMEFLMGRSIFNNLLCLGIYDQMEAALNELGTSLSVMEEIEDAALGNGGLGRLAACFLDSAATLDLPLDGYGIRYKYGLFKQSFEDGYQKESADDWMRYGDAWSIRREDETVLVRYADQTVKAVPYDMPVIGCGTRHISTLRLWQAEPVQEFDFQVFNSGDFVAASREKILAEDISRCLYPNDNTDDGKKLRLKQQYFFCSASLQHLLKQHFEDYGTYEDLADVLTVQLNDTHPVISIPELIRLLMAEGISFEDAAATARRVFRYTNHTIMAEALEKWWGPTVKALLPEIYAIIPRLNEMLIAELYQKGAARDEVKRMRIFKDNMIHMAHMAIFMGSYVNGVAEIHTQILKDTALADWYKFYPERFQNKTNGITQRRWLALCDRELSSLLTELLGTDEWMTDLDLLKTLDSYAEDDDVMRRFIAIKTEKKRQLVEGIWTRESSRFESREACEKYFDAENTVFDIQIKRLHEYKRQLLNAFSILYLYNGIKDGSIDKTTLPPTAFLFGAKAAPGYVRAKAIIKFINAIADKVNADPDVNDVIKVFFVADYNVSYAEKLVSAADISEQISTAGTEASGTGNMKLMLNGAVTLGTYDGANIEIVQEAGEENNYIFGARVEELAEIWEEYDPRRLLAEDDKIRRVVQALMDGSIVQDENVSELYDALTEGASWHVPDHYYVIGDLKDYIETKLRALRDYKSDRLAFARKQWHNICNAGKFSSDRTIREYASEIWQIEAVSLD